MINIDITGFYYRNSVDANGVVTVADAMKKAEAVAAPNGGLLTVSDDMNGFVNAITVEYPAGSKPVSGQDESERTLGTYSFNDDPTMGGNFIPGAGDIDGQLVWQYYVKRKGEILNEDREIVPYTKSDEKIGSLKDDDTIIWRLVAIFGLRETVQKNADRLRELVADGRPMSMKSAIRELKS